jgi:glucose-1-phosphate thymidylyltransferase
MVTRPVALIPAAGRGTRFAAGYIKELYPVPSGRSDDGDMQLRPIADFALRAVAKAGADSAVLLISPEKTEIVQVLGAGSAVGMAIAYVVQPEPLGLPEGVRRARPWLEQRGVIMALPDTVIFPQNAAEIIEASRRESGADLMLGVFPTDEPERLGPVDLGIDGTVRRILEKPSASDLRNSWGIASWSPTFTKFCCEWDQNRASVGEGAIGEAFEAARRAGLAVRGVYFAEGQILDIGTPRGLETTLLRLNGSNATSITG